MSYANATEYATRNLIELAMREEEILEEKMPLLVSAEQRLKVHQWDFQTSDLNEDFSEAYVMAAFAGAGRARQEVSALRNEIADLQTTISAHQVAVQAICGALLQIAKQGISLVHGGLANAPTGRLIGTSHLRDVVWQGRNQAIHYEDGQFNQSVTALFSALEASHGPQFSLVAHPHQSRAKQVVALLDWRTYDNYLADASLLGL